MTPTDHDSPEIDERSSKILARHTARLAVVYIRQSSMQQYAVANPHHDAPSPRIDGSSAA